jgi:hypothetical protein
MNRFAKPQAPPGLTSLAHRGAAQSSLPSANMRIESSTGIFEKMGFLLDFWQWPRVACVLAPTPAQQRQS